MTRVLLDSRDEWNKVQGSLEPRGILISRSLILSLCRRTKEIVLFISSILSKKVQDLIYSLFSLLTVDPSSLQYVFGPCCW